MTTHLISVIRALGFQENGRDQLKNVPDEAWPKLLRITDQALLTLPLGVRCRDMLPSDVQQRIDRNLSGNADRYTRTVAAYQEIARTLNGNGVEFTLLKGLSQRPFYSDDPRHRPQYDIDIFCPPHSLGPARRSINELGYEDIHRDRRPRTDHLSPMIRKTGWRWKGDYYDPEMPLTVEVHFRFWDLETECFAADAADQFWPRRTIRSVEGLEIPALNPIDEITYSALHLLRHLLRGDLRLYHAYEVAHFLDRTAAENLFWANWEQATPRSSRAIAAIAFRLACEWFGCRINPVVAESIDRLPSRIAQWFTVFAWSPVLNLEHPNKDELFLHLTLIQGFTQRCRVARRRIFPIEPLRVMWDPHVADRNARVHIKRMGFRSRVIAGRSYYHLRALIPLIRNFLRWRRASVSLQVPIRSDRIRRAGTAPP